MSSFLLNNSISLLSLFLALFAIALSTYFWNNPKDNKIKKKRLIEDKDNHIIYSIGEINNKWVAKKTVVDNINKGEPIEFYANKKNNPRVNDAPNSLEDLKKLNYDLEK